MQKCLFNILLSGIVCQIGIVAAQEKVVTPPRLRIVTEPNFIKSASANVPALRVYSVAKDGLGYRLNLMEGDIITGMKIENEMRVITSSMDLSRCLIEIREITKKQDNKGANISLKVLRNGEAAFLDGTIVRTDHSDKTDGGTLYFFRSKSDDAKSVKEQIKSK